MDVQQSRRSLSARAKAVIAFMFSPAMRFSSFGFLIAVALAFLGMGITGFGLFFLVTPGLNFILGLKLPMDHTGIDQLKGIAFGPDALWPTVILVSILWSCGFLIAGLLKNTTRMSLLPPTFKNGIYILILWFWALALWVFAIKVGFVT